MQSSKELSGPPKVRLITRIVVHCSDSPDNMDIGIDTIDAWHKERGFCSPSGIHCGYHYVIRRDGKIDFGRPEFEVGAHIVGYNRDSIGICWVGRTAPTPIQRRMLLVVIDIIRRKHGLKVEDVVGHRELSPLSGKTCPNLEMDALRKDSRDAWLA